MPDPNAARAASWMTAPGARHAVTVGKTTDAALASLTGGDGLGAVFAAMRAGKVPTRRLHAHGAPLAEMPDRFTESMEPASGAVEAIAAV